MTAVERDVVAAMSEDWETSAAIHGRIGRWSIHSVRHVLRTMADCGEAESRMRPGSRVNEREYRLKPEGED